MLGQDRLEKILHAALAKYGCTVELGTELKTFEQNSKHVKVKLVKESQIREEGELEEAVYDWMIGTDGARGVVRKQLGLSFLGETRNIENFIVGDIIVEGLAQKVYYFNVSFILGSLHFSVLAYVGRCFERSVSGQSHEYFSS